MGGLLEIQPKVASDGKNIAWYGYSKQIEDPIEIPYDFDVYEYSDIILDNLTPIGDAEHEVDGLDTPTGATSTIMGSTIIQALTTTTIDKMIIQGFNPPVFKSSNVDGGDDHNNALFDKYYGYSK